MKETGEVDEDGNPIELDDVEKEGDGGIGDEGLEDTRLVKLDEEVKELEEELKAKKATPKKRGNNKKVKVEEEEEEKVELNAEQKPKRGRKKAAAE